VVAYLRKGETYADLACGFGVGTSTVYRYVRAQNEKQVNAAHARRRGPGERVNAELKNWRILRKIRSSPSHAGDLVAAVQTLMNAGA
jgi:transposase